METIRVGALVKMINWVGGPDRMGIVTKVPRTSQGRWAILLTSGELIATAQRSRIEVMSD